MSYPLISTRNWRQTEKTSLDTGVLKQRVENYTQENTDPVTCFKDTTLDPVLPNSFISALSEVNDQDLGPLCGSTSSIYTGHRKDRMENWLSLAQIATWAF